MIRYIVLLYLPSPKGSFQLDFPPSSLSSGVSSYPLRPVLFSAMTPHNKPDKQTKPHKTDANMNYLDSAENQEMSALLNDTESSLEAELDCEYGQLNSAPYRKYIFTFSRSIEMGRQRFCSAISCRRVATVFVAAYFLAWVSFGKRSFGNHGGECLRYTCRRLLHTSLHLTSSVVLTQHSQLKEAAM